MFIPLHEIKLPSRRTQRCRFLACSYTTILLPTYVIISVNDNATYGIVRCSKDVIFDDSCVYEPIIDKYPSYEAFAALIEDITEHTADLTHLEPVSFFPTSDPPVPPVIEQFSPIKYQEQGKYDVDSNPLSFRLIFLNSTSKRLMSLVY